MFSWPTPQTAVFFPPLLLYCKNQEGLSYNEAPLWKDRMKENWINVNMAIRLPPSRRNTADLSHCCTPANHFVTHQTFICILLAMSRGKGKPRAKPEIFLQPSPSSNHALKALGEHTNSAVRYPWGKYPFTSQQHTKVRLKPIWNRKADTCRHIGCVKQPPLFLVLGVSLPASTRWPLGRPPDKKESWLRPKLSKLLN